MSGDHMAGGRPLPPPPPSDAFAGPAAGRPYAVAPGYYTHPHQSPGTRPLDGLATAGFVLLGGMAALAGLVAAAHFSRAQAIDRFLNEPFGADFAAAVEVDDANARLGIAIALYAVGLIATGVVFIIWQYRHTSNAQAIGGSQGLGPGWAVGGWFIPFANLVLPPLQIYQSSRASDDTLPAGAPGYHGRGQPVVVVWGVLLALGSALTMAGRVVVPEGGLQEGDIDAANLSGLAGVALALAAVAGIVMVRKLSQRQQARLSAVAERGQSVGQVVPGMPSFPNPPPAPGYAAPPSPWGPPPTPSEPTSDRPAYPPPPGTHPPPAEPGTGWPSG